MSSRHLINAVVMCVSMSCAARAQDILGNWQGTLKTSGPEVRVVLQVAQDATGWKADLYYIDQASDPFRVGPISLNAGTLKFNVDTQVPGTYAGKLSADGNSIAGTLTQRDMRPLEFKRATPETAWPMPDPPKHSVQFITVDKDAGKDVNLEVLD